MQIRTLLPRRTAVRRRAGAAAAVGAALVLTLAACGGDDGGDSKGSDDGDTTSASADGCVDAEAGKGSEAVKVTGDFGKKQQVEFEQPLKSDGMQRTVVTEGDGDEVESGQQIDVLVSIHKGADGTELGSQQTTLTAGDDQMIPAFSAGFSCQKIGSRVVVTAPASEMYGEEGNPNVGLEPDDTVVIVTDVIGEKEQVTPAKWTQDPPKVSFDDDGKPTLELPGKQPAKKLQLAVLEEGDGDTVEAGDSVTLDYQGTSWNTGKVFDQSYGKQPATFATTDVVEGFGAALVGQKVGTKLVVSIPPEYAYGEKGNGQELAGQTLVFVIDIKGVD